MERHLVKSKSDLRDRTRALISSDIIPSYCSHLFNKFLRSRPSNNCNRQSKRDTKSKSSRENSKTDGGKDDDRRSNKSDRRSGKDDSNEGYRRSRDDSSRRSKEDSAPRSANESRCCMRDETKGQHAKDTRKDKGSKSKKDKDKSNEQAPPPEEENSKEDCCAGANPRKRPPRQIGPTYVNAMKDDEAFEPICTCCDDDACQPRSCPRCQPAEDPEDDEEEEAPVCAKCGEELGLLQVLTALGKKWHPQCFSCETCGKNLARTSFFLDGETPFCPCCWSQNVKCNCSSCGREITCDHMVVNFGIRRYHKSCFICSRCRCDLTGLQFCIRRNEFTCQQCM